MLYWPLISIGVLHYLWLELPILEKEDKILLVFNYWATSCYTHSIFIAPLGLNVFLFETFPTALHSVCISLMGLSWSQQFLFFSFPATSHTPTRFFGYLGAFNWINLFLIFGIRSGTLCPTFWNSVKEMTELFRCGYWLPRQVPYPFSDLSLLNFRNVLMCPLVTLTSYIISLIFFSPAFQLYD